MLENESVTDVLVFKLFLLISELFSWYNVQDDDDSLVSATFSQVNTVASQHNIVSA